MYFFYLDESGDRHPAIKKDEPFVMLTLGLHEYQWRRFETVINSRKLSLIQNIHDRTGIQLDLADAEVHSVDIRIPKKRAIHPFLRPVGIDEAIHRDFQKGRRESVFWETIELAVGVGILKKIDSPNDREGAA